MTTRRAPTTTAQPQAGKPPSLLASSPSTGAAVELDELEALLGSVSPSPEVVDDEVDEEVVLDEVGSLVLLGAEVLDGSPAEVLDDVGAVGAEVVGESLPDVVLELLPEPPPSLVVSLPLGPVSPPGGA